jgi:hypothetical protein
VSVRRRERHRSGLAVAGIDPPEALVNVLGYLSPNELTTLQQGRTDAKKNARRENQPNSNHGARNHPDWKQRL